VATDFTGKTALITGAGRGSVPPRRPRGRCLWRRRKTQPRLAFRPLATLGLAAPGTLGQIGEKDRWPDR
jgi:hypothetical protein